MIRKCRLARTIRLSSLKPAALSPRATKREHQTSTRNVLSVNVQAGDSFFSHRPNFDEGIRQGLTGSQITKRFLHTRHGSRALQFCDALFGGESYDHRARPIVELNAIVAVQGDAQNVATWLRGRKSPLTPSDFNALQARFEHLGGVLGQRSILQLISSVADNPAAVKECLLVYDAMTLNRVGTPYECLLCFQNVSTKLESVAIPQESLWQSLYLKQQWLHVITGWCNNGIGMTAEQRAWCLYNIGPDLDNSQWQMYLRLLYKFGNSDVVCSEWRSHQQKHGRTLKALNQTIQCLVRLEDFENAWRLAYEPEDFPKSIQGGTWELLLAHPKYAKEWIPEMKGPALCMLEKEICKIEKRLGLRWQGGQDGFHTMETPEQLWTVE